MKHSIWWLVALCMICAGSVNAGAEKDAPKVTAAQEFEVTVSVLYDFDSLETQAGHEREFFALNAPACKLETVPRFAAVEVTGKKYAFYAFKYTAVYNSVSLESAARLERANKAKFSTAQRIEISVAPTNQQRNVYVVGPLSAVTNKIYW